MKYVPNKSNILDMMVIDADPRLVHICDKCGAEVMTDKSYPYIEWEEDLLGGLF